MQTGNSEPSVARRMTISGDTRRACHHSTSTHREWLISRAGCAKSTARPMAWEPREITEPCAIGSVSVGGKTEGKVMKWMLVVLVAGVTPVNTNLVFDKFSECLDAEAQMRQHYTDAFEAWDRSAAANAERRRDYRRARDTQA